MFKICNLSKQNNQNYLKNYLKHDCDILKAVQIVLDQEVIKVKELVIK